MSLRNKAIHGAKWSTAQNTIGQAIDFVIFITLARMLGPEEFGLVAIAVVFISFIAPFISQGLGAAIIQRSEIEIAHLNTVFWSNLTLGVLLTALIASSAGWWANVFSDQRLESVLIWIAPCSLFYSLTIVQEAILRREIRFKTLAYRSLFSKTTGGVVAIVLAINDFGVWSLVARQLTVSCMNVFLLWRICDWRPQLQFSKRHFADLFPFGVRELGNKLLVFVNRRSDNLLIGYFLGPASLGFYNIAYRFVFVVLQLVTKSVSQVGMPAFSRLQHIPKRLTRAFYDVTQITTLLSFPIFIGMMFLATEIVVVFLGESWLPAIPVLQVLVLIGIAQSILAPMVSVIIGVGKPGVRLKLQFIDSVLNLVGFFIVVHWGIVAVAASYVIIGFALIPLWYRAILRSIPVDNGDYLKTMKAPFWGAVMMSLSLAALAIWFQGGIGDIEFMVMSVLVGAFAYTITVFILYPATAKKFLDMLKVLAVKSQT